MTPSPSEPSSEKQAQAASLKEAGNQAYKKGDYNEAWENYNKAVEVDPTNPVLFANRAQCELKQEMYGSAIESCDKALELDPKFVKCYYRRAVAHSGVFKYSEAVQDLKKLIELAPEFPKGKDMLRSAQSLARYTAFQAAIRTDDEPSFLETIDLESMPEYSDKEKEEVPGLNLDEITDEAVKNLVDHFQHSKRLSRRMVFDVIIRASRIFESEPTMTEMTAKKSEVVTVCGDTHGQFYDLLHIFKENGWPSEQHTYVFNGDFVDRGSWSTEIALLLYILKIKHPKNLYLNRGNHETDSMNAVYGFSGECKSKYGTDKVFTAFSESFSKLPLAALINNSYLVVHGGLFSKPGVTLDQIRKIDRFASRQPRDGSLMMEMLWSDPQEAEGIAPSNRGIAHKFGPDMTKEFVANNGLKAVLRSHECVNDGYEVHHDGQLITVFSAPNYCDQVGNQGAYINIGEDNELNYKQFRAQWHPNVPPMAYASQIMR